MIRVPIKKCFFRAGYYVPITKNCFFFLNKCGNRSSILNLNFKKFHSTVKLLDDKDSKTLNLTFISKDGSQCMVKTQKGKSILEIAHENGIDIEGACDGACACSTCHVIIDTDFYDKLPEPLDEENDMLDLAFSPTETSRLGCQIIMNEKINGIRIALPMMTKNLQKKDFN